MRAYFKTMRKILQLFRRRKSSAKFAEDADGAKMTKKKQPSKETSDRAREYADTSDKREVETSYEEELARERRHKRGVRGSKITPPRSAAPPALVGTPEEIEAQTAINNNASLWEALENPHLDKDKAPPGGLLEARGKVRKALQQMQLPDDHPIHRAVTASQRAGHKDSDLIEAAKDAILDKGSDDAEAYEQAKSEASDTPATATRAAARTGMPYRRRWTASPQMRRSKMPPMR